MVSKKSPIAFVSFWYTAIIYGLLREDDIAMCRTTQARLPPEEPNSLSLPREMERCQGWQGLDWEAQPGKPITRRGAHKVGQHSAEDKQ